MSDFTPVSSPAPSGRATKRIGFVAMIRTFLSAVSEGIEVATRYSLLSKLSKEELAALGLTRKDLARVAVNGWKR